MYQAPLSEAGERRLKVLRDTEDGFRIAEEDLAMRGAGDLIGTAQSGLPRFRVADLERQGALMAIAQTDARRLRADDPALTSARGKAARLLLWLLDQDRVVYCLVIAAVWQASGFVMAMFLAGLRGVDQSIIRAAQVDGANLPTIYLRIVLPSLRPVFFSAFMILAHIAIKSFDLVSAMTAGGPGYSSDLPAMFMYSFTFSRGQMGVGSASAIMMLGAILAILVPYLYSELRNKRHD